MARTHPARNAPRPPPKAPAATPPRAEWDEVAEASWESFPASDPPSWINRRDPAPDRRASANA